MSRIESEKINLGGVVLKDERNEVILEELGLTTLYMFRNLRERNYCRKTSKGLHMVNFLDEKYPKSIEYK